MCNGCLIQNEATEHRLNTTLDRLPELVVITQVKQMRPRVSFEYTLGISFPDNIDRKLIDLSPHGFQLASDGRIIGNVGNLSSGADNTESLIIPVIRNWGDDETAVRSDIINNLLIDPTSRDRHIRTLVDLVEQEGFDGIDLDYRGISFNLGETYTVFLTQLREAPPG